MMTTHVREDQPLPFLLRVIWFFLVGWHATLPWILVAWLLNLTIIGLPLGLWMLNRVPLVLTLRAQSGYNVIQMRNGEVIALRHANIPQHTLPVRALYFVLIGWWFSLLWSVLAWVFSVSIVGLPLGAWMFNRLPGVTTLMRQ